MKPLILMIALACLLLCGCAAGAAPAPAEPSVPETTVPAVAATDPSQEPVTQPTVPPTAPPETEPQPPVLHSGLREDGSFSAGTLFIGDSQTYLFVDYYLKTNNLFGDARVAAQCGSQVTAFFDDTIRPTQDRFLACSFSPEFEGMTFREAAEAMGENATAIYIMWGSNFTPDATAQTYIDIAAHLLRVCPNATIHLQLIPKGDVAYVTVNQRITDAWSFFRDAGESRVLLVDTCAAIGDYIQEDRVHVGMQGRGLWYQALADHAQSHHLEP